MGAATPFTWTPAPSSVVGSEGEAGSYTAGVAVPMLVPKMVSSWPGATGAAWVKSAESVMQAMGSNSAVLTWAHVREVGAADERGGVLRVEREQRTGASALGRAFHYGFGNDGVGGGIEAQEHGHIVLPAWKATHGGGGQSGKVGRIHARRDVDACIVERDAGGTVVLRAAQIAGVEQARAIGAQRREVAMNNMAKLPFELSVPISRARLKPHRGTGIVES
jgi:hypothetical protein